jgi:membrane protease YdiL (CAAX protease family)
MKMKTLVLNQILFSIVGMSIFIGSGFVLYALNLTDVWIEHTLFISHLMISLAMVFLSILYHKFIDKINFGKVLTKTGLYFSIAIIAIYVVTSIVENYLGYITEDFVANIFNKPLLAIISTAITIFLLAPIGEELLFRGFLLNTFITTQNPKTIFCVGALISSTLFALIHIQYSQVTTLLSLFVSALVFCAARYKSGGLLLPIVLHIEASALAVLFSL